MFLNFLAVKFENIVKNRIHFNTSERGLIFVDDDVCCCCRLQVNKPITGDGGGACKHQGCALVPPPPPLTLSDLPLRMCTKQEAVFLFR